MPAAQVIEPSSLAVARGKPFDLIGKWQDSVGLDEKACKLGELRVKLSPRGVTKQGTCKVQHPGLAETTTLNVELVDRAGNRTTLPVKITVRERDRPGLRLRRTPPVFSPPVVLPGSVL